MGMIGPKIAKGHTAIDSAQSGHVSFPMRIRSDDDTER